MGRHSRTGGSQDGDDTTGTAGLPPAAAAGPDDHAPAGPGTGRRRRGPADGEQPHPGTGGRPQGAVRAPRGPWRETVRGGHPEQREPGGGWGLPPSVPGASAPGPPAARRGSVRGAPRVPRPRAAEPDGVRGASAAGDVNGGTAGGSSGVFGGGPVLGPPSGAAGGIPGPRREYLEAFAADEGAGGGRGAAAEPEGPEPDAAAPGGRRPAGGIPDGGRFTGRSVVFDREAPGVPEPRDGSGGDGEEAERAAVPAGAGEAARMEEGRKGGMGRTFTGVAAAAVTTVLAVVVAGQVADHRQGGDGKANSGQDPADPADGRSQARPPQDAKPASYEQRMAKPFPLDAQLTASGHFTPAGGAAKAPGHGKVLRYRVDVEDGMGLDGALFAEAVHKTLNDDRSWAHGGTRTFERVASGAADFVISLASPGTTAKWCAKSGLDTSEENVSCDSAATDRVMINAYRWAQGAKTYGQDKLFAYRQMLINHEVGHRLGHDHEVCGAQGALAPVMMQQTKFLTTDGVTCRPNAWPYPTGN
ncbi:DUF3152 domain-containing protein [Streptomyces pinistramenti]|uniref:DUF3152 domain-containing protein n=1 Tax=Streptomyces pinistramenti TaxID=2884812 RepID=UPI001D05EE8A|nr:DUF3152 domain-containing protein [Streptomyces pinistramenti]MCB5912307.1 DUF3152 domain-containing protein [Streptomyces pinistramenti]